MDLTHPQTTREFQVFKTYLDKNPFLDEESEEDKTPEDTSTEQHEELVESKVSRQSPGNPFVDEGSEEVSAEEDFVGTATEVPEKILTEAIITEGPQVNQTDDSTPVMTEDPASIAACEATVDAEEQRGELCQVLLIGLVMLIMEDVSTLAPEMKNIIPKLRQMLMAEIAGHDIPVDMSVPRMKKIIKAVKKDLRKKASKKFIQLRLLAQDEYLYRDIIQNLKRHLCPETAKKKNGAKRFFKSAFKSIRDLVVCFWRCLEALYPCYVFFLIPLGALFFL